MKKQSIFLLIIAVLFALIYQFSFDSKLDLNGDNANYIRLAQHLSQGLGYSTVSVDGVAATNFYPPGYAFFLSLFMSLGISSLVFFKILNGVFLLLSIGGMYYLVNKLIQQPNLAFVIAVLTIFSPQLMHFATMAMSEMLYLFTTVVGFISLYMYASKDAGKFWKSPYFYVAIVAAAFSMYVRTVGSTLIFATILFFMFRKEWLAAVASAVGIVLLNMPWSVRNSMAGLKSRYMDTIMTVNPWRPEQGSISSVGEMVDKIIANFDEILVKGFKEILFPFVRIDYQVPSGFFAVVLGLLILGVIFYGAWHTSKLRWFFLAYLVASIGLLLLWHGGNGSRYLVTIAPLLFVLFYVGIYQLLCLAFKPKPGLANALPFVFLLMVFFMVTPLQLQAEQAKSPYPPAYKNYFAMATSIQEQAPKGTIVCCRKPELFTYYAPDAFAVHYKYSLDAETVLRDLIDKRVEFVVLEQLGYSSTGLYLYPAIQENIDLFPVVWHLPNPDTYLLKFERDKAIEKLGWHE